MTMPHERTRALVFTREFLRDLQDPSATPDVTLSIRQRARALARHYPTLAAIDLAHMALPGWYGPVAPFLDPPPAGEPPTNEPGPDGN
ncbi:BPSL0761 family protein [Ramlibacter alkalitolerans]|uniref:BPSL0761 family protein n=1 Tax=Ramlibacter alkalitolerans TaxID=2039631 RepID=UPI0038B45AA9